MRSHRNRKIRKKATESRKNLYIPAESWKATPSHRPSIKNGCANSDFYVNRMNIKEFTAVSIFSQKAALLPAVGPHTIKTYSSSWNMFIGQGHTTILKTIALRCITESQTGLQYWVLD